tara:strand:+ start:303 stop:701 length:399 start_codon:yes stop_codon:yes gene_type:complete
MKMISEFYQAHASQSESPPTDHDYETHMDPHSEQKYGLEMFYEYILELSLCFYSLYFWEQLSSEYVFLKEHIYAFAFMLFKLFKFCFHLVLLAISISIALNWGNSSDKKLDLVQITMFIAILDYIILRETQD